jgi:hypothetical protein
MQAQRTLMAAKKYLTENKHLIGCVVQGVEALAAPLVLGIGEGRLAPDGSGHIQFAGVPLNLALGAIGTAAAASGYIPEYSSHIGNMAAGLLGSYGADLGRQIGLGMRLKSGHGVQQNLLDPVKEQKIRDAAAKETPARVLPAPGMDGIGDKAKPIGASIRIGEDFPNQYYTLGAAPGQLTAAQLEQMVREAAAASAK